MCVFTAVRVWVYCSQGFTIHDPGSELSKRRTILKVALLANVVMSSSSRVKQLVVFFALPACVRESVSLKRFIEI